MDHNTEDISNRMVRLETKVCLKFEEMEKALVLARDQIERGRVENKESLDYRLEGMNQFQKRMDKLEGTFATKTEVANVYDKVKADITANSRLIYIGVGALLAFQIFMAYFKI